MIVYFPSLIAGCLILNSIQYRPKTTNHPQLWPSPGSLDPSKTVLPPGRKCNPVHSGVPGPVRDLGQALGICKGLQHDVQGHPQQPKWTSKGMPSTLQWQTNGQQLAIHRIIETSYHRILSLGAGGRGRSPSDIYIYVSKQCIHMCISIYVFVFQLCWGECHSIKHKA